MALYGEARGRTLFGRPLPLVLVVLEKSISALLLLAGGVLALILRYRSGGNPVTALLPGEWLEDPRDNLVRWLAAHLPEITPHQSLLIAAGLFAWGLLFAVEAVGVWGQVGWAELLVIVETAAFLPAELWHLAHRPDLAGLIGLAVNVLILVYITRLYRKRAAARG